jgi:ATP-dependent helicase/nuclease subunit B
VGKTNAVKEKIGAYLSLREKGKSAIFLVPEQSNLQVERDITLTFGNQIGQVCEVLSFKRLCHRVFSQTGNLANLYIDKGAAKLIMGLAVKKVHSKLKTFDRAAATLTFLDDLMEAVAEWKSCEITPNALAKTAEEENDEGLKDKLSDLALLYSAYEEILKEGYLDPRDDIDRMCDKLVESRFLEGKTVFVDGFWSFSPQELRAMGKMMEVAQDVYITLPLSQKDYSLQYGVFSGPKRTYDKICRIAHELGVPVTTTQLSKSHRFQSEELKALEERLFSYRPEVYEKKAEHITLCTCENVFSEVEYASSQIMRLVRERGYAFSDFTIIARDLNTYGDVLKAVFSRCRIPLFISQRKNIITKPILLLVLSALETVQNRFGGDSLFRLMKTGMYTVTREEGDILENYAILWNIRGRAWEKDFGMHPDGFYKVFDEKAKERLNTINLIRKKAVDPLIGLTEELKGKHDAKSMCTVLYRFLLDCQVTEKIKELTDRLSLEGQLDLCAEYGQLWQVLMTALDQMAGILGSQKIELGEFCELLKLILSGYDIGIIPTSLDEVTVGSADQICPPQAKCVFLLGVNDGQFPKVEPRGGLLTEEERETLQKRGLSLSKTAQEKLFDEQFLMYSAVCAASQEVYFCCPRADMAGQGLEPSQIIWKLLGLFPHLNRTEETEITPLERIQSKEDAIHLAAQNYSMKNELVKEDGEYRALYRLLEEEESLKEWSISLAKAHSRKNLPKLSARLQKRLEAQAKYQSPSQIERFYSCRFAYFMQYMLRAKPRVPIYVSGAEIGIFVHAVLEDFFERLKESKTDPVSLSKEERDRLIKDIVARNIEKIFIGIDIASARFRYLFYRIARLITTVIDNMIEELSGSDFKPVEFELDIGGSGEGIASYTITTQEGFRIRVGGKVDKIDGYEKDGRLFIRVVDYKTGNRVFDYTDVLNGLNLQMLIYLFAVCKNGDKRYQKEIKPAGVLYLHVHEPVVALDKTATEEQVEKEVQKALKMNGLILNDTEIINAMEHDISKEAKFIPVTLSKSGEWGAYAISDKQFANLNSHIEKMIQKMGSQLYGGDIAINPYIRGGKTPCTYCDYKAACLFDLTNGHNKFRNIKKINRQEFFERIGGVEIGDEVDAEPGKSH